jgi:hypothetical protein
MSSRSFWRNEADKIRNDRSAVDTSELFANPWEEEDSNPKRPNHLREIQLTLTAETKGSYILAGFVSSRTHPHGHGRTENRFRVPLYKLIVEGLDNDKNKIIREYWVVKFGVRDNPDEKPKLESLKAGEYPIKSWLSEYLGGSGAWVVNRPFYIHDGQNNSQDAWGGLGCIELVGTTDDGTDKFMNFNYLMRKLSGTKLSAENKANKDKAHYEIAKHQLITIIIEPAPNPPLIRLN